MSSRQIRRLQEQLQASILNKDRNEEEDIGFEPLYMNNREISFGLLTPERPEKTEDNQESDIAEISNGAYSLLLSDSHEEQGDEEDTSEETPRPAVTQKKKKNNRKKKNKRNRPTVESSETNEVERAVAEVNSVLGEPKMPSVSEEKTTDGGVCALLKVNHKYLSKDDEFTRRFGPDDEEQKRHQRPDMHRICRRHIVLSPGTKGLSINGLNMVMLEKDGDVKYFKYVHSPKYQSALRGLISHVKFQLTNTNSELIYPNNTIEAVLQNVDLHFSLEEVFSASNALEALIMHLQYNFCAAFNYVDGKTRLEYKHVENRPFHIILLKYLYWCTNKACHRTALEIAKVLLSLDPTDPLGVIFIMDTLALRAREYQWLADIYKYWETKRDVGMLFHMVYSHALAKYHIQLKSKNEEDIYSAEFHLRDAIVRYPNVAVMLLAHCNVKNPTITEHEMFTKQWSNSTMSKDLQELQALYVKLAGPKWREDNMMKWFVEVALQLIEDYDGDNVMQAACCTAATFRDSLFKRNPIEITRHLFVMRSMSNLLIDGQEMPSVVNTYAFNPYPLEGNLVDAPNYFREPTVVTPSGWRNFLSSLVPSTNDFNGQT